MIQQLCVVCVPMKFKKCQKQIENNIVFHVFSVIMFSKIDLILSIHLSEQSWIEMFSAFSVSLCF